MSFTYLSTAPNSSSRSWIRLRIGDNSSADQLMQDEDIDALLAGEGNRYLAAAVAAETIGARFARRTDKRIGRLSVAGGKQADGYFRLAKRLRVEAGMRVAPYAGGIDKSDVNTERDRTDRVAPSFEIGQFDYPGTSTVTTST